MGYVNNTVDIMQAIDIMILPSLFEGLPLIAIESQALGIPILVSDTITQEVVLTDLCSTLPMIILNYGLMRLYLNLVRINILIIELELKS